ncbi:ABC transporter ATP-binding protein [archaeon]|jgi:ATP-binding cassette, subfamily B, heavy metal transporter|nr:ABC transporter ATP-binding protein [archaeon]MBT4373460.1 ABC transporter ATP-binding protein [archaeon]MBT4531908.1 ABC transporter ATP-binding protein [archaeon]MBT7001575.1 ABC transporter ATP-binding protein [archaeon]MBT7282533.1 ABC transporter ATP-binding protein [archaeon]
MKHKKRKIDFKHNLGEYWQLLKKYKLIFLVLTLSVIITELVGVGNKFLFKRIIDDGEFFIAGTLASNVFVQTLIWIAVIYIGINLFRVFGKWINVHLLSTLDAELILDIKQKYFNHIIRLDHNFHTTHKTGSLISRMVRGAGAVVNLTDTLVFNFAPLVIQLIAVGISVAYFSMAPALVILGITISFIVYSFIIQQKQQSSRLEFNNTEDIEKGMISDIFTNIDSVKYFGKEKAIQNKYQSLIQKTKKASLKNWGFFRWWDSGQIFIISIGTFLIIYFPLKQFLAGEISLGTIVFIYTIYSTIVGPMFSFVWGMRGFYRAMADFQDLFEYGKFKNEIKDKAGAKNLEIKEGIVEFRNVNFSYGKRKLFENFNLKIKKNEKVALVGHSGCGKTTLIKLLNRLYDVKKGEILIDGKDIREFKQESIRGETGIVPQEAILFDDTIYNNIKFANPKASREEVLQAIKFAQLDKIILNFPKKENTIVGERGVKLSGGEKQRVSIARAILANKKVLVLDEATSALDSETESEIQKDLYKLMEGRTAIMIAHRLSTIMAADTIVVMKEGKIIQKGSHDELIKQKGEYNKLWNLQKGGYIE